MILKIVMRRFFAFSFLITAIAIKLEASYVSLNNVIYPVNGTDAVGRKLDASGNLVIGSGYVYVIDADKKGCLASQSGIKVSTSNVDVSNLSSGNSVIVHDAYYGDFSVNLPVTPYSVTQIGIVQIDPNASLLASPSTYIYSSGQNCSDQRFSGVLCSALDRGLTLQQILSGQSKLSNAAGMGIGGLDGGTDQNGVSYGSYFNRIFSIFSLLNYVPTLSTPPAPRLISYPTPTGTERQLLIIYSQNGALKTKLYKESDTIGFPFNSKAQLVKPQVFSLNSDKRVVCNGTVLSATNGWSDGGKALSIATTIDGKTYVLGLDGSVWAITGVNLTTATCTWTSLSATNGWADGGCGKALAADAFGNLCILGLDQTLWAITGIDIANSKCTWTRLVATNGWADGGKGQDLFSGTNIQVRGLDGNLFNVTNINSAAGSCTWVQK